MQNDGPHLGRKQTLQFNKLPSDLQIHVFKLRNTALLLCFSNLSVHHFLIQEVSGRA